MAKKKKISPSSFPPLRVTRVYPVATDEWYGVQADFEWAKLFDVQAYREAVKAELMAWRVSHPNEGDLFRYPVQVALDQHIKRQIVGSPQWAEFYSRPRKIVTQQYEGGPEIAVTIPRFAEEDIRDLDFDERGGSASANTR
jgi:hypothetical protein